MSSARSVNLNYERRGSGEPLLLIHGTGSHWQACEPVLNTLAVHHDVIAVDLPGHGGSEPTPSGTPPTAKGFAPLISAFLREELGIDSAHVAGNSMGGWTALEMAKLGHTRSVTALCPAGLWRTRTPRYCIASFRFSYALSRLLVRRGTRLATSTAAGRTIVMGQYYGRPWKIPAGEVAEAVRNLAESPGFLAHLEAATPERFSGGTGDRGTGDGCVGYEGHHAAAVAVSPPGRAAAPRALRLAPRLWPRPDARRPGPGRPDNTRWRQQRTIHHTRLISFPPS